LPQALQDRGGWETRDTADAFADYAGYVAERLSDRARHFFTLNEFVELGHATGGFAGIFAGSNAGHSVSAAARGRDGGDFA
jgi:beta-glucosidase/6-phospho-beta-glucosidase/beta-galactosidase